MVLFHWFPWFSPSFRYSFHLVTTAQKSAYITKWQYSGIIIHERGKVNLSPKKTTGGTGNEKSSSVFAGNPVQYLATVGRDGKAKCRPFTFAGELDGKLWFCTNVQKEVYKDIQENPDSAISVSSPSLAWIRLHGRGGFAEDRAAKEMCISNPIVQGQYGDVENPIFTVFYLDDLHGVIADFSGTPPYQF